jgi:putative FmdB family regulatory protein
MPIFEYQCPACGYSFEKVVLVRSGAEAPACPRCQAAQTRQLVSRFSSPSTETGSFACTPSAFS